MSEYRLTASSALDGFSNQLDGISLAEVCDLHIVSVATPQGGEALLADALAAAYSMEMPAVGSSVTSAKDNMRILGLAKDQAFMVFNNGRVDQPLAHDLQPLRGKAHLTDQSDSWAVLNISGPRCREALERICPIDLSADQFAVGSVARTVMEHLGVIIYRNDTDSFLMLSAASSARSFLHVLQTSIRNILLEIPS